MKLNIKLPKELTTVTKTSKTLAFAVFITLPFLGFFLGTNYQASLDSASQTSTTEPILPKRIPTPAPSQAIDTSNWKTYINSPYRFTFKYPAEWTIVEEPNYISIITPDRQQLVIDYKKVNDNISIVRSGVAAGDIYTKGTVKFLNQNLTRQILNFQGKDKSVLYNGAGEIIINNLAFSVSLDSNSPLFPESKSYEDSLLDQQTQDISDQILQTFQFIN